MKEKENAFLVNLEYKNFIKFLKQNISNARQLAIRKVNNELINLYYFIGKQIVLKQKTTSWGDDLIGQIEKDLKREFPDVGGFSRTNLFYMKKLFIFFGEKEFIPQAVGQIPWGHIRLLLDRVKNQNEVMFYIKETIENNWSRVILEHQIDLDLYGRQGKLLNNFKDTISDIEVGFIENSFKETYILDFLDLSKDAKERELEKLLVENIANFLMELGRGFAFVGKQYKIVIDSDEFFIDLLFYNYILRRFVVIELKTTDFRPEHLGQIGFYLTVIDKTLKTEMDNAK